MSSVEHSLFEEGYLLRDLRAVAEDPEVAIAELVANAWDAGASQVHVTVPTEMGQVIQVSDNGVGMTPEHFRERWMRHGYNRIRHQGEFAEFPPERKEWIRRAYGRNGIGRHGLLCFSDMYTVETRRFDSNDAYRFTVKPSSGKSAFDLVSVQHVTRDQPGTTIWATLQMRLPDPLAISESLTFKFLYDPRFAIFVDGVQITLDDLKALESRKLKISNGNAAEVMCIKAPNSKRWRSSHGVAFWIGNRLVGEPVYGLHGISLLDGRTTVANQYIFVVKSNDFFDDIESDWTRFKKNADTECLAEKVSKCITALVGKLTAGKVHENQKEAIRHNRDALTKLKPLARIEISEFVETLTNDHPTLNTEILSSAVKAAVNLEKSRSGQLLLDKLATISDDDVDAINSLLDTWTMRDALVVLDEIDRRMSVVEALGQLMGDSDADELHSIHPLVSQARWLFGPEFDSPIYSSNVSIRTAAAKVFKKRIDAAAIKHPRRRPDLIFLKDATVSITGTEQFDDEGTVTRLDQLLLVELKRGNSTIGIDEMQQAERYVTDLLRCGLLDGPPFIHAFVAGHNVETNTLPKRIGDPTVAKIEAVSYGQLVRTAHRRLFKLQEHVGDRYNDVPGAELVDRVLRESRQTTIFENGDRPKKRTRQRSLK